jgi:hypothetical protein
MTTKIISLLIISTLLGLAQSAITPNEFIGNQTETSINLRNDLTSEHQEITKTTNEIRDDILDRLKYPMEPGSMMLTTAFSMNCNIIQSKAPLFMNKYMAFSSMIYMYLMRPQQKVEGAFSRLLEQNQDVLTNQFMTLVPPIMDASNKLFSAFSNAVEIKNKTLIKRYQNCSADIVSTFNLFADKFSADSVSCLAHNVNYGRVDDLLVETFTSWNEIYSGMVGCCALAKDRYPTDPMPPNMASQYLDQDSNAVRCLEKLSETFPVYNYNYPTMYPDVDPEGKDLFAYSYKVGDLIEKMLYAASAFQNKCSVKTQQVLSGDVSQIISKIETCLKV